MEQLSLFGWDTLHNKIEFVIPEQCSYCSAILPDGKNNHEAEFGVKLCDECAKKFREKDKHEKRCRYGSGEYWNWERDSISDSH